MALPGKGVRERERERERESEREKEQYVVMKVESNPLTIQNSRIYYKAYPHAGFEIEDVFPYITLHYIIVISNATHT